jgi:hypothetical protein
MAMLKSYEAIYDHGHIRWLSELPDVEQARIIITVLPQESLVSSEKAPVAEKPNGARLVSILRATPTELLVSIAEKFGDPVEWQREQRKDRVLPGREDD